MLTPENLNTTQYRKERPLLTPENLNGQSLTLTPCRIPAEEWGGEFYVAELDGIQRDQLEGDWREHREANGGSMEGIRAFFVAFGWCDDENKRLVPRERVATVAADLARRSCRPLARAFDVFCEVNGLLEEDVQALVGNSKATSDA